MLTDATNLHISFFSNIRQLGNFLLKQQNLKKKNKKEAKEKWKTKDKETYFSNYTR